MNGKELDALVAEKIMGWRWKRNTTLRSDTPRGSLFPVGKKFMVKLSDKMGWSSVIPGGTKRGAGWAYNLPRYSTDIAAAFEMESMLCKTEGLAAVYGDNLAALVQEDWDLESGNFGHVPMNWACAHASPALRCLAALQTVREYTGAKKNKKR